MNNNLEDRDRTRAALVLGIIRGFAEASLVAVAFALAILVIAMPIALPVLHVLIGMSMQNAVCRVRHDARQRRARWLLTMHERVYGQQFLMSQEALAVCSACSAPL
jgi:hypothetical protein